MVYGCHVRVTNERGAYANKSPARGAVWRGRGHLWCYSAPMGRCPVIQKEVTSPELGGHPLPRAEPLSKAAPNLYLGMRPDETRLSWSERDASAERGWSLGVPRQKARRVLDPMAAVSAASLKPPEMHRAPRDFAALRKHLQQHRSICPHCPIYPQETEVAALTQRPLRRRLAQRGRIRICLSALANGFLERPQSEAQRMATAACLRVVFSW